MMDAERYDAFKAIDDGWRLDVTSEGPRGRYDKDNKPEFDAEREADETKDKGYDADHIDSEYLIGRAA